MNFVEIYLQNIGHDNCSPIQETEEHHAKCTQFMHKTRSDTNVLKVINVLREKNNGQ